MQKITDSIKKLIIFIKPKILILIFIFCCQNFKLIIKIHIFLVKLIDKALNNIEKIF